MEELRTCSLGSDDLEKVIDGGFCIGCGACAVYSKKYEIYDNEYGLYQAKSNILNQESAVKVCPFSSNLDEDKIGEILYSQDSNFDEKIGFYKGIYAGHVKEDGFRVNGSSGGLVTWVLTSLLRSKKIDAVIHVGKTGEIGKLFGYRISETIDDIQVNAKSRYYPVHFDEVVNQVRHSDKTYAFVGVPCFVKAVRLLMANDEVLASKIKYCIAIFCGHLKTKAFSEMVAWQQKVSPKNLVGMNFRVKNKHRPANQYSVKVEKKLENGDVFSLKPILSRELYGMDWGLGLFKPKACDWCDDIAGETADLSCGDAWLPEFERDSGGTNIVVVRNTDILQLIQEGISQGSLDLKTQSVEKVYQSQAGNFRHRQEGLSVRTQSAKQLGVWYPKKRVDETSFTVHQQRQKIYMLRSKIAQLSHKAFKQAKERNSFLFFVFRLLPFEIKYHRLNGRLFKGLVKSGYQVFRLIFRRCE